MAGEIHNLASGTPFGAAPGAVFMTRKFSETRDIIKLAILAIGGQGGGVLADWIVDDNLPVRFQLQLHKVLWGDQPGK